MLSVQKIQILVYPLHEFSEHLIGVRTPAVIPWLRNKTLAMVAFEPTSSERLEHKSTTLDHFAIL